MKAVLYIDWYVLLEDCEKLQIAFFYTEHEFRAAFNDFSLVSHERFLQALRDTVAMADADEQPLLKEQYEQVEKRLQNLLAIVGDVVYINIEGGTMAVKQRSEIISEAAKKLAENIKRHTPTPMRWLPEAEGYVTMFRKQLLDALGGPSPEQEMWPK